VKEVLSIDKKASNKLNSFFIFLLGSLTGFNIKEIRFLGKIGFITSFKYKIQSIIYKN